MKFNDVVVNRDERYSIGKTDGGKLYVSIPVSNGLVDYEEYYEIDQATFDRFSADAAAALAFVVQCRNRQMDDRLIIKPGSKRGTAV